MRLVFNAENQWILLDKGDLKLICYRCNTPLHPIEDEHFYLCRKNKICFHNSCERIVPSLDICKPKSYTTEHIHIKVSGIVKEQNEMSNE